MSKQNSLGTVDQADIVIVGNGIAGLTAAVEMRRLEPEKSIVMVTNQSHPTINTPALKQFAIGKLTRDQLLAYPPGTERTQRIHLVNGFAEEIHAQESYVRMSGGQCLGYGSLLLATGNRPNGLPTDMPGQDFDGVMTLHRLYDYLDLRRRLNEVEEAVVIGGGVHAIETVMGLLYWGIRVHWLIRSDSFMPRMLDREASDLVLEGARKSGAKVYTETEVVGIVGRVGMVAGVVTTQQQMLPCQLVLVCTGTTAVTALARTCDLPMKYDRGGILVDDGLRTSVRNVYAAGDVAALRDPLTGKYAPRALWYAAVLQGRVAAASITGAEEIESFGVSWHATRLGDLTMLTVGNPLSWPDGTVESLTERRKGGYCTLSLVDDRLVGYLALGSTQPDSLAIKRIIDEGLSVRDIKKDLLRGEFDARKYFSGKRTYAAQRMITTGQLPTPLPPLPGILAGESQGMARIPKQLAAPAPEPLKLAPPKEEPMVARLKPSGPLRDDTAVRMAALPPRMEAPGNGTAARMAALPPRMGPPLDGTSGRMNAMPPSPPRMGPPLDGTSGRMNAMPPSPPRMGQPRGDAEWLNAEPSPRMGPPLDGTSGRMNAMPPSPPRMGQPRGDAEWLNAEPPATPQGSDGATWMNASPRVGPGAQPQQSEPPRRITDGLQHPATEPLVRQMRAGSRSVVGPRQPVRHTDEQRKQISEQLTLAGVEPVDELELRPGTGKIPKAEVELVKRAPDRQFIAPPGARPRVTPQAEDEDDNPHPSRSLWHYTGKHPAVMKGKKHVQE